MIENEQNLGERKKVKNVLEELNLGLMVHVIYGSLLYVLIFIIITITIAIAYLRWTPDVYETKAVVMAKSSKQTQLLGLENILRDDDNEIKLEIQLMKSSFLITRALDSLNLNIEYYTKGNFLALENFNNNPFKADLIIHNEAIENKEIYITLIDNKYFQYKFQNKNEEIVKKSSFWSSYNK
jgi:tyrosine-protein kinase Etk/Wzc